MWFVSFLASAVVPTLAIMTLSGLTFLALLRWKRARRWSPRRRALISGLIAGATNSAALFALLLHEWTVNNGFRLRGLCPASPTDIPSRLCTFAEFAAHNILSPFSFPGLIIYTSYWVFCWFSGWVVIALFDRDADERTRSSRIGHAFGGGVTAASSAGLATLAIFASVFAAAFAVELWVFSHQDHEAETISANAYFAAWGLPIQSHGVGQASTVQLPKRPKDPMQAAIALPEADAIRVLKRWPKQCWQSPDALPGWIREAGRLPITPVERAPKLDFGRLHVGAGLDTKERLILVGIQLTGTAQRTAEAYWARSFEAARHGLLAGDIAWTWFAIEVDRTAGKNYVTFLQRGYEADMSSWRPICESSGAGVDALINRTVPYGFIRGLVEDHAAYYGDAGHRIPVPGATVSFEHEDGFIRERVTTAANGWYRIALPDGRYHAVITHPDYSTYSTGRGWIGVEAGRSDSFWRVFLKSRPAP